MKEDTAADILKMAYGKAFVHGSTGKFKKPGSVIESLTEEERDSLKTLKPEDITLEKLPIGIIQYCASNEDIGSTAKKEFDLKNNWKPSPRLKYPNQ